MTNLHQGAGEANNLSGGISERESIARYLEAESRNKLRTIEECRTISILAENVRARLDIIEIPTTGEERERLAPGTQQDGAGARDVPVEGAAAPSGLGDDQGDGDA